MTQIDLKDMRVNYVLEGAEDAPVLVLSNSLGTDLTMWDPQIPQFVKRFRVLRYDTRGHGQSSAPPGSYSIAQLAEDVLDLLNKLKIEQAFFCGLSIGGMIGQWLGVHAADRMRKLVLANTAAKAAQPRNGTIASPRLKRAGCRPWFPRFSTLVHACLPRRKSAGCGAHRSHALSADPQGYVGCCAAIRDMDQREQRSLDRCAVAHRSGKIRPGNSGTGWPLSG